MPVTEMGPLPDRLVGSCQAFPSMVVEFLYPVEFWGTVNKKQTGKEWGVILVCTATSAIHVNFSESYSTDRFLMALKRFLFVRGTPFMIQFDTVREHRISEHRIS